MAFTLFATIENKHLKLAWNDGTTRLPAYCVLLSSVVAHSESVRKILGDFTQDNMRTGTLDYGPYLGRLQEAGAALFKELFDAKDNEGAAQEAEDMLRASPGRADLSIFSEICVPWGFVCQGEVQRDATSTNSVADFASFWSSRFALTLRGGQSWPMEPEPRKRDHFRMLHALHRVRFDTALDRLPAPKKRVLESIVDYAVGNVTNWDVCRDKWKAIEENDSLLHIFGHSDGEKVYLQDPVPGAPVDNLYCLEADRFKGLFGKKRQTRSVTVCFLNGCRTGAGPVGESFLDVLFDRGFQGFVGTEAEVSNEFAVLYAGEFMSRLWYGGLSIRKAFDELREELFPLSLMYSCYAHPDFRIEAAPRATDVEYHRACA